MARETVAFSKWDYPVELTKEQKEEKLRKQKEGRGRNVEGSNQALLDEYFEYVRRGRERWILEGKTFCEFLMGLIYGFPS